MKATRAAKCVLHEYVTEDLCEFCPRDNARLSAVCIQIGVLSPSGSWVTITSVLILPHVRFHPCSAINVNSVTIIMSLSLYVSALHFPSLPYCTLFCFVFVIFLSLSSYGYAELNAKACTLLSWQHTITL